MDGEGRLGLEGGSPSFPPGTQDDADGSAQKGMFLPDAVFQKPQVGKMS